MTTRFKGFDARVLSHSEFLNEEMVTAAWRPAPQATSDWSLSSFEDRIALTADSTAVSARPSDPVDNAGDGAAVQVFGCGCGCAKEGLMLHGDFGVEQVVGSMDGIADEPTLTVEVGGSVSGFIDETGDVDNIEVDLVAGQTYLISLRGTGDTPLTDSFLEINGTDGVEINQDDDGGNGTFSLITITALTTGTYTIDAASFANEGDAGLGEWTVDVRRQKSDEAGDTNETAADLGLGTSFGFISTGTDVDRYEITLEAGQVYTFSLAGGADYETNFLSVPEGELDTILRLFDASGNELAEADDISFPADISSRLSFVAEESGTYYLDVDAYPGQTGGYVLDVVEQSIADLNPLDSINWFSADNVPFENVGGVPTATVYFGEAGETFGEPGVSLGWNQFEIDQVMLALEEYEEILGVNYEVTDNVDDATFRLFTTESQSFGAYFYPQDPAFGTQQGIGAFNVLSGGWTLPGQETLERGGFSFAVILHEFGHAHGLAHPHDTGGGSDIMLGVDSPFDDLGYFDLNQGVYTVMSYNDAWQKHPDGPQPFTADTVDSGWSATLSAFDIAVLQDRYGVLNPNETGNNVYRITDDQDEAYYECIWDTGGKDSIEYEGSGNATIDLTAATLDYTGTGGGMLSFVNVDGAGIWGGYTIANGVVIENAKGSDGDDMLVGNDADNVLSGKGGADTLAGGGGRDKLYGTGGGDSFYFEVLDKADSDKVFGFKSDGDTILVDDETYGLEAGALDADIFVIGNNAEDADDRFIYNDESGKLYFDADGSGGGDKVLIAKLTDVPTLEATDIIVI